MRALLPLVALLLIAPVAAQEAPPEALACFHQGNELFEKGQYAEALARYQEALKHAPDLPTLLWNAGQAAQLADQPAVALELWKRLEAQDPEDWRVLAKLIQAYQALGEADARDASRQRLLGLRQATQDPELKQLEHYCRDQFTIGEYRVMAFEHFELEGERAIRYYFAVVDCASGQENPFHLSLGSYEGTNSMAREAGTLAEGVRLFHLDGYGGDEKRWTHQTYEMYEGEPSYDQIRAKVIGVLGGREAPLSQSSGSRP